MLNRFNGQQSLTLPEKLCHALDLLLVAFNYASDTGSDRWEFAVSIFRLREVDLDDSDMRWLVRKGYVDHAREVTLRGDDGREFRSSGNLTFTHRTCFVLTDVGVAQARLWCNTEKERELQNETGAASRRNRVASGRIVVQWDGEARKLRVNGKVVKRFKWPAANQEAVLNAFQEEGWPERIDDPLSPQPEQDPKRRLSDTIKCLNRKQTHQLIHFRGDGTGEGVVWELIEPDCDAMRAGSPSEGRCKPPADNR